MRFVDRALASTIAVFCLGVVIGDAAVMLVSPFQQWAETIIQVRMLTPVQTAAEMGSIPLLLLVFLNNSIPALLSFLYPWAVVRIAWTPPLSERRRRVLMAGYTYLSGILTGLFGVGVPLGLAWALRGMSGEVSLLFAARIHAPLELFFVLVCIAEPLRLAYIDSSEVTTKLREHALLLWVSIVGLLLSAGIEVFTPL
jgi:hypothetical protein